MKRVTSALVIALLVSAGCSSSLTRDKSSTGDLVQFRYQRVVETDGTQKTELTVYPLDRSPGPDLALLDYSETVHAGVTRIRAEGVVERNTLPNLLKDYGAAGRQKGDEGDRLRVRFLDRHEEAVTVVGWKEAGITLKLDDLPKPVFFEWWKFDPDTAKMLKDRYLSRAKTIFEIDEFAKFPSRSAAGIKAEGREGFLSWVLENLWPF